MGTPIIPIKSTRKRIVQIGTMTAKRGESIIESSPGLLDAVEICRIGR
jgi:hypothetical protein